MKISRKSKRTIDQVFIEGEGWVNIRPIPLRKLWWKNMRKVNGCTAVHFVDHGDYLVTELRS